ncbi:hypothetical protein M0Q97_04335 [Candidatus Dojkabacteria bacterium]|jgi:hypothetical protein|nr:hypothetical protein [Candidatus Dojkabacteria bacterium]
MKILNWEKFNESIKDDKPVFNVIMNGKPIEVHFLEFTWDAGVDNSWKAGEDGDANTLVNALFEIRNKKHQWFHMFLNKSGDEYTFDCENDRGQEIELKFATRNDANRFLKLLEQRHNFPDVSDFNDTSKNFTAVHEQEDLSQALKDYMDLLDEFNFPVRLLY